MYLSGKYGLLVIFCNIMLVKYSFYSVEFDIIQTILKAIDEFWIFYVDIYKQKLLPS
ncbi:MAG: hypothetical protein QG673_572 [Pseudomonadota bacterium]|nr:hypothetical protein [Pseudomonadota bacterium]